MTWKVPTRKVSGLAAVGSTGAYADLVDAPAASDGQVLDSLTISSTVASVTLDAKRNQSSKFRRYEIIYDSIVSDVEIAPASGSLLTVYVGDDTQYYETDDYMSGGISEWAGEPNISYQTQPQSLWIPQTLSMGFRLTNDVGSYRRLGSTGHAFIYSPGLDAAGVPIDTKYHAVTQHGLIGGAANTVDIPSITLPWSHNRNAMTGKYFSGDVTGKPFDWSSITIWHGLFRGAPGVAMHRFLLKMNGGGDTSNFVGGYLELRGYGPLS